MPGILYVSNKVDLFLLLLTVPYFPYQFLFFFLSTHFGR